MVPENCTWPEELAEEVRSRWPSFRIYARGTIGSESTTPWGTVSIMRSKIAKHFSLKESGCARPAMVILPSEEKIRRSELVVWLLPTTSGPPRRPVPLRYSFTPVVSRISGVLSKWLAPSVLVSVIASVTMSGKFASCTEPIECPHATAWIISLLLNPAFAKAAVATSSPSEGRGTPAGPGSVASTRPARSLMKVASGSQDMKLTANPFDHTLNGYCHGHHGETKTHGCNQISH